MKEELDVLEQTVASDYKYGFVTEIDTDVVPKGLNEDVIRMISHKKNEPEWMLQWRLKAYAHWLKMEEPTWPNVHYPKINYQDIIYYAAPRKKKQLNNLDEVDPELLKTFDKLGISLN
jgi:Fe-S cluster assembly protein SufB